MLRQISTILFLIIAQIVLLGHELIAHHHYNQRAIDITDCTSDNQKDDDSTWSLAFSAFMHTGEHATFIYAQSNKTEIAKNISKIAKPFAVLFENPTSYIAVYQKHTFPPNSKCIYNSLQKSCYTLRGPPFFFVG
ncbi:hypothetical protein [Sphingobacterium sp. HSC-15S19]|uniref:hypothetical protein n=1 Tax=Sphingobacterium TaxID=28453 RepID=UPI003D18FF85